MLEGEQRHNIKKDAPVTRNMLIRRVPAHSRMFIWLSQNKNKAIDKKAWIISCQQLNQIEL